MKKAVFFDIDGTLWDFKMNIPESTKKALKEKNVRREQALEGMRGEIKDEAEFAKRNS